MNATNTTPLPPAEAWVDSVLVERLAAGGDVALGLTPAERAVQRDPTRAERRAAVLLLAARGASPTMISQRLGMSGGDVHRELREAQQRTSDHRCHVETTAPTDHPTGRSTP